VVTRSRAGRWRAARGRRATSRPRQPPTGRPQRSGRGRARVSERDSRGRRGRSPRPRHRRRRRRAAPRRASPPAVVAVSMRRTLLVAPAAVRVRRSPAVSLRISPTVMARIARNREPRAKLPFRWARRTSGSTSPRQTGHGNRMSCSRAPSAAPPAESGITTRRTSPLSLICTDERDVPSSSATPPAQCVAVAVTRLSAYQSV
jgi:hypothetical protein